MLIQSVRLLAVAILTGGLAATAWLDPARAADADRFPAPERPVASVLPPAYPSEGLRNRPGEAQPGLDPPGTPPGKGRGGAAGGGAG